MTACGREACKGKMCGNFGEKGCKGVNTAIPPWSVGERRGTLSAAQVFREQDYRACADKLAEAVAEYLRDACTVTDAERLNCWNCIECDEPTLKSLCMALYDFQQERDGTAVRP